MTYRLSSLMATIALVAFCLATSRLSSGFATALVCLFAPAYLRTVHVVHLTSLAGNSVDMLEKLALFVASIGVVVIVATTSLFTFTVLSVGGIVGGIVLERLVAHSGGVVVLLGAIGGMSVGGSAALGVAVVLLRQFWSRPLALGAPPFSPAPWRR